MKSWEAAGNALRCVLQAKKGESTVIFCDAEKSSVCESFTVGALRLGLKTHLVTLKTQIDVIRTEIPASVKKVFEEEDPDIFINLLREMREETPFRIELTRMETKTDKARVGHCPGITSDMLTNGALALTVTDHRKMQRFARKLIKKLAESIEVEVTDTAGTRVLFSVERRPFFTDTTISLENSKWINLPTGEVMVAPVEDSLDGQIMCSTAVGGIGPIKAPVRIVVKDGKVKELASADDRILKMIRDSLQTDNSADNVGEFAFGINHRARFVQQFLETEKVFGTTHIAFGNNSDMPGGKNKSRNHMDFLITKPTVKIHEKDGSCFYALVDGVFQNK
jgi:aminopeptidase